MIIRTPEQFWESFGAWVSFVVEEKEKNPDFEIPKQFIRVAVRVKSLLDEIWPQIEERYLAIKAEKLAQIPALSPPLA
jgi:hypothetical protein